MDSDIIDLSKFSENVDSSFSLGGAGGGAGGGGKKSSNFGGGLELLMNEKKKDSGTGSSEINLDDLNLLERELNDLADEIQPKDSLDMRSDIFSKNSFSNDEPISINFDKSGTSTSEPIKLGQQTSEVFGKDKESDKTWDGYSNFNNIPLNPDKEVSKQPQMSKEELLREKFKYLRKLESLEAKGVNLTKKYNMESSLAEMQGEYEMIMEEKSKQNSVKFQGNMLMACINGIEFLNNRFDPFDIKLDGWSDQVNENLNDYDEIFGELYDKYKSRASLAPELKLLFQLGGSAMMVHMTNTMFKTAMPGMDDILRQNPDLMRQFQTAAVNTMGQTNPGLSGFMSGIMSNGSGPGLGASDLQMPSEISRPGNNNGATMGRTAYNRAFNNDGINISENYGSTNDVERSERSSRRPEMKGPSDITDILSGLKTKTIQIQDNSQREAADASMDAALFSNRNSSGLSDLEMNENSTISISDLKELQTLGNMPKKSKRRGKSDKNTLSLDI